MVPFTSAASAGVVCVLAAWLGVNLLGAFCAGLLIVWLLLRPDETLWLRALLMVGLLGGLTTFSAMMVDVLLLWHEEARLPVLVAYLGSSLLGGLLAVWLGWRVGQHWFGGS